MTLDSSSIGTSGSLTGTNAADAASAQNRPDEARRAASELTFISELEHTSILSSGEETDSGSGQEGSPSPSAGPELKTAGGRRETDTSESWEDLDNAELWERRYRTPGRVPRNPEPFVKECVPFMKDGPLLDIACGEGRNALYLAGFSDRFSVFGIDRSQTAVETCRKRAALQRLMAKFKVWDLEKQGLPEKHFNTIIVIRYWQEDLCPLIAERLAPGGCLVYETYTAEYLKYGDRCRSHLLNPGQLRRVFEDLGLRTASYCELDRPETREYTARLLAFKS